MPCIDSNVIIDLAKRRLSPYQVFTNDAESYAVSVITVIECLGFPFTDHNERAAIGFVLDHINEITLTSEVRNRTIELRSQRRIKLGDALIAATTLEFCNGVLITRNVADFSDIQGITVINPFTLPLL